MMSDYERIKREYDLSLLQKGVLMSKVYPVGSIYMSINEVSPAALFGGVWERIQDAFLLAASKDHPVGETGGAATVALTEAQMPEHYHDGITTDAIASTYRMIYGNAVGRESGTAAYWQVERTTTPNSNTARTVETGGGEAHNNMPPYLSVYMWVRIK